ncbi:MAG: T9SS type A sorting domain-containing protein, partial [Bacteroidales bacterium]|nr:T9SS type A sorting domain-containing protein [Bacteroidales bacterium]
EVNIPEVEMRIYPNPARERAVFELKLSKGADVEMKLYNTTGQLVGTVLKSYMVPGVAQLEYDTQNLPGGLYIVELHYDGIRHTDKLIVGNK